MNYDHLVDGRIGFGSGTWIDHVNACYQFMSIPTLVKAMLALLLTALLTPVVPQTEMSFGIGLLLVGMTSN